MMTEKKCTTCHTIKPIEKFYKNSLGIPNSVCKPCQIYHQAWKEKQRQLEKVYKPHPTGFLPLLQAFYLRP